MQTKDIPTEPILEFLAKNPKQMHNWCWLESPYCIANVLPKNTPDKLIISKMNNLIKKGLVDGCTCGCRGDYYITNKGLQYLNDTNINRFNESESQ